MVYHRSQELLSDFLWGSLIAIWEDTAKHMHCLKIIEEACTSLSVHLILPPPLRSDYILLPNYTYGETASQRSQVQGHTPQKQPDLDLSAEILNFHTNTFNHLTVLPSRALQAEFQIINSYVIFTDLVIHNIYINL